MSENNMSTTLTITVAQASTAMNTGRFIVPIYQRDLDLKRMRGYPEYVVQKGEEYGTLTVNERPTELGVYYLIDGRHRWVSLVTAFEAGMEELRDCKLHLTLLHVSESEERYEYIRMNDYQDSLTSAETDKARIITIDPETPMRTILANYSTAYDAGVMAVRMLNEKGVLQGKISEKGNLVPLTTLKNTLVTKGGKAVGFVVGDSIPDMTLQDQVEDLNNYYTALVKVLEIPLEGSKAKQYIVFKAIGLHALTQLYRDIRYQKTARVTSVGTYERIFEDMKAVGLTKEYFDKVHHAGKAGATGATAVYRELRELVEGVIRS